MTSGVVSGVWAAQRTILSGGSVPSVMTVSTIVYIAAVVVFWRGDTFENVGFGWAETTKSDFSAVVTSQWCLWDAKVCCELDCVCAMAVIVAISVVCCGVNSHFDKISGQLNSRNSKLSDTDQPVSGSSCQWVR